MDIDPENRTGTLRQPSRWAKSVLIAACAFTGTAVILLLITVIAT